MFQLCFLNKSWGCQRLPSAKCPHCGVREAQRGWIQVAAIATKLYKWECWSQLYRRQITKTMHIYGSERGRERDGNLSWLFLQCLALQRRCQRKETTTNLITCFMGDATDLAGIRQNAIGQTPLQAIWLISCKNKKRCFPLCTIPVPQFL